MTSVPKFLRDSDMLLLEAIVKFVRKTGSRMRLDCFEKGKYNNPEGWAAISRLRQIGWITSGKFNAKTKRYWPTPRGKEVLANYNEEGIQ